MSESTSDRILDAAEALFAERGLAATTMRDIGARVGLNAASLYNHFQGKQAIYEAVLDRGVRPLIGVISDARNYEPLEQATEKIVDALMAQLRTTPHLPRLIWNEAVTGGSHLAPLVRRWMRPLIEGGLAQLEARQGPREWEPEEFPMLVGAWMNLVLGYFAMAPLLGEAFQTDPLSAENLARQTAFLKKLMRQLEEPTDPS